MKSIKAMLHSHKVKLGAFALLLLTIAAISSSNFRINDMRFSVFYHELENEEYSLSGTIGDTQSEITSTDGNFSLRSGFFAQVLNTPPVGVQILNESLSQQNINPDKVNIAWNPVKGATNYQVQWDTTASATFTTPIDSLIISNTSLTFASSGINLDYNRQYFWRVRALSTSGVGGEWSRTAEFTTLLEAPTFATNVIDQGEYSSSLIYQDSLIVQFNEVEGATSYQIRFNKNYDSFYDLNIFYATEVDGEPAEIVSENGVFTVTYVFDNYEENENYPQGALLNMSIKAENDFNGREGLSSDTVDVYMKAESVYDPTIRAEQINNSNTKRVVLDWEFPYSEFAYVILSRRLVGETTYTVLEEYEQSESNPLTGSLGNYIDTDPTLVEKREYEYKLTTYNIIDEPTDSILIVTTLPDLPILSNLRVTNAINGAIGNEIELSANISIPTNDTSNIQLFYSVDGTRFTRSEAISILKDDITGSSALNFTWQTKNDFTLSSAYFEEMEIQIRAFVPKYNRWNQMTTSVFEFDNMPPSIVSEVVEISPVPWNKMQLEWTAVRDSSDVTYSVVQTSPSTEVLVESQTATTFPFDGDVDAVQNSYEFEVIASDVFGNSVSLSNNVGERTNPTYVGDYTADDNIDAQDLGLFALSWGNDDGGLGAQTADLEPYQGTPPFIKPTNTSPDLNYKDLAVFSAMWNALKEQGTSKKKAPLTSLDANRVEQVSSLEQFVFKPTFSDVGLAQALSLELEYSKSLQLDSVITLKPSMFNLSYDDSLSSTYHFDYVKIESIDLSEEPVVAFYFSKTAENEPFKIGYNAKTGMINEEMIRIYEVVEIELLPSEYALGNNYPNPFNPTTTFNFDLPENTKVTIQVFDALGRKVRTLADKDFNAGSHQIQFDARSLSSGVYFYRIMSKNFTETKKMLLLR